MMYPETPRSSQQAGPKVRQGALTEVKCAHVAATEEKGVPFRASVRDTHPLTTDRSGRLLRAGCELDASWMRAGCELDASWMRAGCECATADVGPTPTSRDRDLAADAKRA